MNIVKLASRNVLRNWRRTLVTILAMAFAGFIMILFAALMEGLLQASERNAVTMDVGDIQIHKTNYRDDPDLYKRIDNSDSIMEQLNQKSYLVAPRLYGFALAASGSSSAGIQLRSINIEMESKVTQIHRHILAGQWLSNNDPNGVVIGKKLARILGVDVGAEVVIVGQAADGSMANDLYRVRGILKSVGVGLDRTGFFLIEPAFRNLMAINDGVHEIVIMRPDRRRSLEAATADIAALATGYEVMNWRQLRPIIARILDMADSQVIIMIIITYIAVAMVVLNALLMGVFERIREFGIMKAIGVSPWQITALVIVETIFQVAIASLLALSSGWGAANYYQQHGIDLTAIASSASFGGVALDPIWYASVTTNVLLTPIVFLLLMALVAVIYPAIKAALIEPVKAIHYR